MTSVYLKLMTTVLAIGFLPGCQNFMQGQQRISPVAVEDLDLSSYFAQRLAEGRSHLRANRPGAAIVAYRQASYDPALRATAYNGMAIAFDSLGRADLAQEYFMAAIALAPENVSFANNFIRFGESRGLAFDAGPILAESQPEAARESEVGLSDPVPPDGGMLQRDNPREVRIVSHTASTSEVVGPPSARPATVRVERRADNVRTASASYPIRFSLADVQASGPTADVPVAIATEDQRVASRSRVRPGRMPPNRGYPIRVHLRESS